MTCYEIFPNLRYRVMQTEHYYTNRAKEEEPQGWLS